MKKITYFLSCCLLVIAGAFTFAGCGSGREVASIQITAPEKTVYEIGQTLDLKGGTILVKYTDGTSAKYTMSNIAQNVYIDYGASVATNKNVFLSASNNQKVVVRYEGKSDTFSVRVTKKVLTPTYNQTYHAQFDGTPHPLAVTADSLGLPNGTSIESIEYKLKGTDEFTTQAPINAGEYDIKLNLNGGNDYQDKVIDNITYMIDKTDLINLVEGKVLNLKSMDIVYGQAIDLNNCWLDASGETVNINSILNPEIARNLHYYYRLSNSEESFTELDAQTVLNAGAYDIKVVGSWTNNINLYSQIFTQSVRVNAKTLVYGQDYVYTITRNGESVTYTPTANETFQTNIKNFAASDEITVGVTFLDSTLQNAISSSEISYNYRANKSAEWKSQAEINTAGEYRILLAITLKANNKNYVVSNDGANFQGIIVEA